MVLGFIPETFADWEYTKWGMTPEQVATASQGAVKIVPESERAGNEDDGWEIAAKGRYNYHSLVMNVEFAFDLDSGGLKCVFYNGSGPKSVLIKEMLTTKFGPPEATKRFVGVEVFTWSMPDHIELTMGTKPDSAAVEHCE